MLPFQHHFKHLISFYLFLISSSHSSSSSSPYSYLFLLFRSDPESEKIQINITPPSKSLKENYNSDELDLLALFFTLVKILYVVGCLEIIPLLIDLISTQFNLSLFNESKQNSRSS
jgi:hypothetical protein